MSVMPEIKKNSPHEDIEMRKLFRRHKDEIV